MGTLIDSPELTTDRLNGSVRNEVVALKCTESDRTVEFPLDVIPELMEFLDTVLNTGRRRAFRVPVTERDVQICLEFDNQAVDVIPMDLSVIGVGLKPPACADQFELEQSLRVVITHNDQQVKVEGCIKNNSETLLGISFPRCFTHGELTPPEELRRIVQTLQLVYIRKMRAEAANA